MDRDRVTPGAVWVGWTVWVVGVVFLAVPFLIVTRTSDRLSVRLGIVRLLGLPLVVLGIGIGLWATRSLTSPGGTPFHTHEPEELVTAGPYRYSRNPIYVSGLCTAIGGAILIGHLGLAGYAVFLAGYFRVLVGIEERQLADKYGAAYTEYRETVPRWFPRPAIR